MKKLILIFIFLATLLITGCAEKSPEQQDALSRLDPQGVVESDIWNKDRDEILTDDPSIVTQEPASSCYKDIQNYYGYPAIIQYVFKGNGYLGGIIYVIKFSADSEVKNMLSADIYPTVFNDLTTVFGEGYTGTVLSPTEIKNSIKTHDIGSTLVKWNTLTIPKPALSFSVFSEDVFTMIFFEA